MYINYLTLSLAWIAYFLFHSLLASLWLKEQVASKWPSFIPAYRLMFNITAIGLLVVPLGITYNINGPMLWVWDGLWFWAANGLALLAITSFLWSLRYYDGQEFIGLRQLRDREESVLDQEHLHISPLHRIVRHPWYFLALVLLWTRDMNGAWLVSTSLITLYFFWGSHLEEKKLVRYHGEAYRRYQKEVPGIIPRPWRYLKPAEAQEIEEFALHNNPRRLG